MTENNQDTNGSPRFAELFEQSLKQVKEGELVRGTVLSVDMDNVQLDIGFKSEGMIPTWEFMDEDGTLLVKVGDIVDVLVEDAEDEDGHIVLSKEVPQMIRERIGGLVDGFLARHSLTRGDLQAYILHPGGQKLLHFTEQELGLCRNLTQPSWDVLRDFGNLSSASVLFVLHQWLNQELRPGDRGLLAGFGPGFSAEMLLLQWT